MSPFTVTVEAIAFVDAFRVMVDQREVPRPEWMADRAPSPAAVAGLPPALRLDVALSCSQPGLRGELKASRVAGTLSAGGPVLPEPVAFGDDGRARVPMQALLADRSIQTGTIEWRWEFSDGSTTVTAGETAHQVALTLAPPTAPWIDTLPWWEVIAHACTAAKASTDRAGAATRLAHHTFSGFGTGAFQWESARHYATNGYEGTQAFDCAKFLRLIDHGSEPRLVDCSDLAAALSTFANILGCALEQVVISGPMVLNPVLLCGLPRWNSRFDTFHLHEFTAAGPPSAPRLWDGCLHISDDDAPERPGNRRPPGAALPVDIDQTEYFDRLIFEDEGTLGEREAIFQIRPIGELPPQQPTPARDSPLVRAGRAFWSPPDPPPPALFGVSSFSLYDAEMPGWVPLDPRPAALPLAVAGANDAIERIVWRPTEGGASRLISATVYLCADVAAAHLRTLALLGELAPLDPYLAMTAGVASARLYRFETAEGSVVLSTVMNVVYLIRRATAAPLAAEVRQMSERIRSRIALAAAPL